MLICIIVEINELGNMKIALKLVDKTELKQIPETNNLKTQKIKVIDSNEEEIEKEYLLMIKVILLMKVILTI